MKYDKLVRDKIPEYIREKGGVPVIHIAGREEYWRKLKEKLLEEIEEFKKSESKEEIADILEVVDAIIDWKNFDKKEINRIKREKARKRGKFRKGIILEES